MNKAQEKELNKLLAKAVRLRDKKCLVQVWVPALTSDLLKCGGPLQTSHIYPKGKYKKLKWDIDNVIVLCQRHHLYTWWHSMPHLSGEWIRKIYPYRMKKLDRRAMSIEKIVYNKNFYEESKKKLEQVIDEWDIDFEKL